MIRYTKKKSGQYSPSPDLSALVILLYSHTGMFGRIGHSQTMAIFFLKVYFAKQNMITLVHPRPSMNPASAFVLILFLGWLVATPGIAQETKRPTVSIESYYDLEFTEAERDSMQSSLE